MTWISQMVAKKNRLSQEEELMVDEMQTMLRVLCRDETFMRVNHEMITFTNKGEFVDDYTGEMKAPNEYVILSFFNDLEDRTINRVREIAAKSRMEDVGLLIGQMFGLSGVKDEHRCL